MNIAIVHDSLTQRGGGERVVLSMLKAFPDARVYTALYEPDQTYEGFRHHSIHTLPINRIGLFRRHHRLAMPFMAPSFSRLKITADTVICSSSGWSHGTRVTGRKIVYCYSPAKWLYEPSRYFRGRLIFGALGRIGTAAMRPFLTRWDRRAASTADRYLTLSTWIRESIARIYGIQARIISPPHSIDPEGPQRAVQGIDPGYFLCVARLVPYKNVSAVVEAFRALPDERLVVVGDGPERRQIQALAGENVRVVSSVGDEELRWLYANCKLLIAVAYEDFGLTPVEAAAFGRPSLVLRWGGYLDTVVADATGRFIERPTPDAILAGIEEAASATFDPDVVRAHASRYSENEFISELVQIVEGS